MKKIIFVLLIPALGVLTGCNNSHVHTFDSKWSYNETSHWHAATCEHKELTSDLGEHIDINSDHVCDVCGYNIPLPPEPIVTYIVSFDSNYGSFVSPQVVSKGSKATKPDNPNRNNFVFFDWFDNKECSGEPYNFENIVTHDLVLYAQWGHSVSFIDYDGSTYQTDVYLETEEVRKPIDPVRENKSLYGWYLKQDFECDPYVFGSTIDHNITLYARYCNKATLLYEDKTIYKEIIVFEGQNFEKPQDPLKPYYTFDKWYTDEECFNPYIFGKKLDSDITLYSNFIANHYRIIYENSENLVHNDPEEYVYGVGVDSFDNETYDSTGTDRFYGWYLDEQLTTPVTSISKTTNGDITLYAKRAEIFDIEYVNWPEDLNNPNKTTYTKYEEVVFDSSDISAEPGFTFTSFTISDEVVTNIPLGSSGDKSVNVNYVASVTRVTINPFGGKIIPNETYIYVDMCLDDGSDPIKLNLPSTRVGEENAVNIYDPNTLTIPNRDGYVFSGFYLESDYQTRISETETNVLPLGTTIYAKWTALGSNYLITNLNEFKKGRIETPFSKSYVQYYAIPYNVTEMESDMYFFVWARNRVYIYGNDSSGQQVTLLSAEGRDSFLYVRGDIVDFSYSDVVELRFFSSSSAEESFEMLDWNVRFIPRAYRVANILVSSTDQVVTENYYYWSKPAITISREGYEFLGWSYNGQIIQLGERWLFTEEEMTLTALWMELPIE